MIPRIRFSPRLLSVAIGAGLGLCLVLLIRAGWGGGGLAVILVARANRIGALVERCPVGDDDRRDECVHVLAVLSKDVTFCGAIGRSWGRLGCRAAVPGEGGWMRACATAVSPEVRDQCYAMVAENMRDAKACPQIQDSLQRSICATRVATALANVDECGDDERCLKLAAARLRRPEVCSKTKSSRVECLNGAVRDPRDAATLCAFLGPEASKCLAEQAKREPLVCELLEPSQQESCYEWAVSNYSTDPTICTGIRNPALADRCYEKAGVCTLVTERDKRELCIALHTKNPATCFTLEDPAAKERCARSFIKSPLVTQALCEMIPKSDRRECDRAVWEATH